VDDGFFHKKIVENGHRTQDVRPFKVVGIFGFSLGKMEKVRSETPRFGPRAENRGGRVATEVTNELLSGWRFVSSKNRRKRPPNAGRAPVQKSGDFWFN
jgi:hypothetical protein